MCMTRTMEEFLRAQLSTSLLRPLGGPAGGCISNGQSYETDTGPVFVKHNSTTKGQPMFEGEKASLEALMLTDTVRVPRPIKVAQHPSSGWVFIMEHLDIGGLNRHQAALGTQLARLHLHNISLREQQEAAGPQVEGCQPLAEDGGGYVSQFGFPCQTSCGLIPMPNDWRDDWVEFYCQQRLGKQLELIEETYGDQEARELWPNLQRKIPSLFQGLEVLPSLLHGDLWSGNAGETSSGPVIFDPASFYGHHEFDLAIAGMFGGFTRQFYDAYHKLIPKAPGFAARSKLYTLFHYLNHWNHFGSGYRSQSIFLMKELAK